LKCFLVTVRTARGEFTAGTNKLLLEDGHIIANGKGYGTAVLGDTVLLDGEGRLFVNGQWRQPDARRPTTGGTPAKR
jgi:hypothetical protein